MGQYANAIIELKNVPCKFCRGDIWVFITSQDDIVNSFHSECNVEISKELIEDK